MCDLYHITEELMEAGDMKISKQLACFIGIRASYVKKKPILMQFKSILSCLSLKKEKAVQGFL